MIQALYIIWSIAQVSVLLPESGLPNTLNSLHASQQKYTAKLVASASFCSRSLSLKYKLVCSHS